MPKNSTQDKSGNPEMNYFRLLSSVEDIGFLLDKDGHHIELFGKWAEAFDHSLFIGKNSIEVMGEEEGAIHQAAVEKVKENGSYRYTWSKASDNGDRIYFDTRLTGIYSEGELEMIFGLGREVTEFMTVHNSLSKLQKRHEFIMKALKAGIWDWDIPSGTIYMNDQRLRMLGYSRDEMSSTSYSEWERLIHPDDLGNIHAIRESLFENDSATFRSHYRIQHKDGHWVSVMDSGAVYERDNDGNPTRLIGANLDVTDQAQIILQLSNLQQQYGSVFERSVYPKMIEKDGIIVYCNDAAARSLGYDNKEVLIGKASTDFSPVTQPDGRSSLEESRRIIHEAKEKGIAQFEWTHISVSGEPRTFDITLIHMEEEDYRFVELRDITEEKQNAIKLKEAYKERGILLSEIHHRVKNNLATVTGLLQLQKANASDDFVSESLDKSIQRIGTIAQIHKELYSHQRYAAISLKEHIQNQLDTLLTIYSDRNPELTLDLNMQDMEVRIEQVLPIGLFVNEILTNIFKYAFQRRDKGTIYISLEEIEDDICLKIGDNGEGIPEDVDKKESLGTTLIESFATQLDATLERDLSDGLIYILRFKKFEDEHPH